WDFAKDVVTRVKSVCETSAFMNPVPKVVRPVLCFLAGVGLSLGVTPTAATMAAAHWCVKEVTKPVLKLAIRGFEQLGVSTLGEAIEKHVKGPLRSFLRDKVLGPMKRSVAGFKILGIDVGGAIGGVVDGLENVLTNGLGDVAKVALEAIKVVGGG